jgi:hypothetical protein
MNVEIGTEAEQFPEKEDINGIFIAVGVPFTEQNSFFCSLFGFPLAIKRI